MNPIRAFGLLLLGALLAGGVFGIVLATTGGQAEVRVNARVHDDGRVEVGVQQLEDGAWGDRSLPDARYISPDVEAGRWYTSSAVSVTTTAHVPEDIFWEQPDYPNAVLMCAITHERAGDRAFWSIVEHGIKAYDREHPQVRIEILRGETATLQSEHVRQCVADGAVALMVTLPDPDGVKDALLEADAANVLISSFNSGVRHYTDVGSLRHISIDEVAAGQLAGERLSAHGVTGTVLCITHEAANIALSERCDGVETGYDGEVERLSVAATGTADIDGTRLIIARRLGADDQPVAAVVALNGLVSEAVLDAEAQVDAEIEIVSVGRTTRVLEAVVSGDILFAIDTQAYNQGYLVASLTMHNWAGAWIALPERFGVDPRDILRTFTMTLSPRLWDAETAQTQLEYNAVRGD